MAEKSRTVAEFVSLNGASRKITRRRCAVRPMNNQLPAKSLILGVWSDGKARAYPLRAFNARSNSLNQELDGIQFKLVYDHQHKSLRVAQADEELEWMYSFWFAWYAFRPHTEVYSGRR